MTMDVNCVPMEEGRKTGTLLQTHRKGRLTSQKSVYQHGGRVWQQGLPQGELSTLITLDFLQPSPSQVYVSLPPDLHVRPVVLSTGSATRGRRPDSRPSSSNRHLHSCRRVPVPGGPVVLVRPNGDGDGGFGGRGGLGGRWRAPSGHQHQSLSTGNGGISLSLNSER